MKRSERVREYVAAVLQQSYVPHRVWNEATHLLGVSQLCALLAQRRGLDAELAAVSGLLHDIFRCRTGLNENHAHNSEEEARPYLRDLGLFTVEE
jgi:putative nucleotidyltransferase with HDIG domain